MSRFCLTLAYARGVRDRVVVDVIAASDLAMLFGQSFQTDCHEGNVGVDEEGRTVIYD